METDGEWSDSDLVQEAHEVPDGIFLKDVSDLNRWLKGQERAVMAKLNVKHQKDKITRDMVYWETKRYRDVVQKEKTRRKRVADETQMRIQKEKESRKAIREAKQAEKLEKQALRKAKNEKKELLKEFKTVRAEMKLIENLACDMEADADADDAAANAAKLAEKKHDEEADAAADANDEEAADAAMTAAEEAHENALQKQAMASKKRMTLVAMRDMLKEKSQKFELLEARMDASVTEIDLFGSVSE